jgi:hypothetical protein
VDFPSCSHGDFIHGKDLLLLFDLPCLRFELISFSPAFIIAAESLCHSFLSKLVPPLRLFFDSGQAAIPHWHCLISVRERDITGKVSSSSSRAQWPA